MFRRACLTGFIRVVCGLFALLYLLNLLHIHEEVVWGQVAADASTDLWGKEGPVWVIPVKGTVETGLAEFVRRSVEEAHEADAGLILFEINTFGGRVDAATEIRDILLRSTVPTAVYVADRAISAGALIALAGQRVLMSPGATIGAAEPRPADEKTVSYVRAEFEATAERMGRDPRVAAAMVDPSIAIDGLVAAGQILTLTAAKAAEIGFIDGVADNRSEALRVLGYHNREVVEASPTWAERFVRFVTEPTMAQILLIIGYLALLAELTSPGWGLPGFVGVLFLGLFYGSRLITGLVGIETILLALLGIVLIIVEIFLIPGFGIAGILGIGALGASIYLAFPDPSSALHALAITAVLLIVAAILLLRSVDSLARWKHIVLKTDLGGSEYTPVKGEERKLLVGKEGVSTTPLRPAGIIEIDGEPYDAVSEGSFIPQGVPVRVVKVESTRIVVRQSKEQTDD